MCECYKIPALDCHTSARISPVIGVRADEPIWRRAQCTDLFWQLRHEEKAPLIKPMFSTSVRTLWDARYLYIAFECESPDVWATKTQRDDKLWDDPVVEVFLDVRGDGKSFFEFQINPLGTIYDSYVADAQAAGDWQRWCKWDCEGLQVAVTVDGRLNDRSHRDKGWSAEIAIPFDALAAQAGAIKPKVGDTWRANFTRYERAAQLSAPELSAWAPVVGCFDDLARFGLLHFVK